MIFQSQMLFSFIIERLSQKTDKGKSLTMEIMEECQEGSLDIESGASLMQFLTKHIQFESMEDVRKVEKMFTNFTILGYQRCQGEAGLQWTAPAHLSPA